jgi:hypothetical protein
MFKNLKPLQRAVHRALRFAPVQPYHFAAQEVQVPIMAGEAAMIAREYVIAFSLQDQAPPLAVVGVRQGANAYVRPSGHWVARYVPAHVRRYPFILAEGPSPQGNGASERQFTMMIVADAPHLGESAGELLFNSEGEPAPVLQKVREVLISMQRDTSRTLQLMQQIEVADLLIERDLKVRTRAGAVFNLKGLRVIDSEKFAALSAETLHDLHRSGALQLIQAHLISLSNLRDSPLIEGGPAVAAPSSDAISFEGIDWSRLGRPADSTTH